MRFKALGLALAEFFGATTLQTAGPAIAAGRMVKIVVLVQKADDVFSQAESIIANVQTNEADASAMASPDGPGGRFYAAERDLQNAVGAIPPTGELTSQFSQGTVRLGQFDNFVYLQCGFRCPRDL